MTARHPEVDHGRLSAAEASSAEGASAEERFRARQHYMKMLEVSRKAAKELRAAIFEGVPRLDPLPSGGYDGMAGLKVSELMRHIRSFAWATRALWIAADHVCELEDLPDDGAAEGIVWQVDL